MGRTYHEMLEAARRVVSEVSVADLAASLRADPPALLDVREPAEWDEGVISGATTIPRGILEYTIESALPDRHRPVAVYCEGGHRSLLAAATLLDLGYRDVVSVRGGITAWRRDGHPVVTSGGLDADQQRRYRRHLVLDGVGEPGQRALSAASVAIIGAGGLGSPAALYLAAAGVGRMTVIDPDTVSISNLQRQVLHDTADVGRLKVDSAIHRLRGLNPHVTVSGHPDRLSASTALEMLKGHDVVIDGADNFPTRYLVNDASLHLRLPVVHGSILRFEGQASVFTPYAGPCYRCLFPEPPPPHLAPSCAEAGVLGALPGIIGSIQAMEALKLILGVGTSLAGRLLTYDALEQRFTTLRLERNRDCPACGDEDHPPRLVDYDDACRPAR